MFKYFLADKSGVPLDVQPGIHGEPTIVTESVRTLSCHWAVATNSGIETITAVEVRPNESIMITDLIITSSKKVTDATIIPLFDDGTNSIDLITIEAGLVAVEFSHAFTGGIRGWKDADFKITTNKAAMNVETLVAYVRISSDLTLTYSEWNANR